MKLHYQWFCFLFSKLPPPFVLGIYVTFLEDCDIYIIVFKTEFEVNIVLRIVQHILMKGEHWKNGKKRKIWACLNCVLQDIRKHTQIKHRCDSSGSQQRFHGIKIITQEMETPCLHAWESRLIPFWENSCLIGKNFKPFFLQIGKLSLGETAKFRR
jgi:hypothetical protein